MFKFKGFKNKIEDDSGTSPGGIAIVLALILSAIIWLIEAIC